MLASKWLDFALPPNVLGSTPPLRQVIHHNNCSALHSHYYDNSVLVAKNLTQLVLLFDDISDFYAFPCLTSELLDSVCIYNRFNTGRNFLIG